MRRISQREKYKEMIPLVKDSEGPSLESKKTRHRMAVQVIFSTIGLIVCFGFLIVGACGLGNSLVTVHLEAASETATAQRKDITSIPTDHNRPLRNNIDIVTTDPTKRALWSVAAVEGAIATFVLLINGADLLYGAACLIAFLARHGVISRPGTLPTIPSFILVGILLAAINYLSYRLSNHSFHG